LSSKPHTYINLAYSLVSFYFWFFTVKSSWVHSCTQGLFPLVVGYDVSWLLQDLDDSCRSGVRSYAWTFLVILSMMLLLDLTLVLACIWNNGDVSFKLFCFHYFWTWVVITLLNSDVCWTTCEMDITCDLLCWITTILACMLVGLKSLVISLDYQSYMGSSMTIWSLRWLFLYLCSYNLCGSVTTGIGARFNIKHVICVFKTKAFVKNLNFKLKCASGHILYAQLRTLRWLN
jgi:hypothetical protein